jgi:mono/diheme cytochrome c family protein
MRYLAVAALVVVGLPRIAEAQGAGLQAYYTDAQATRGAALFKKHCAACHFAEPDPDRAKRETAGYPIAKIKVPSNLGGTYIIREQVPKGGTGGRRMYTTVYYLFRELESMPALPDSITQQERTDILTYLLKQNRFPAGRDELKFDLAAMKAMALDEPGFVPLFNGKDFAGLKFLVGVGCAPPPDGCGRTTPGKSVEIRDRVLRATAKEHALVYTEKTYKDFTLRFDYMAEAPADWDGEDDIYYYANSGYHLMLQPENLFVWARALTLRGEPREVLAPIIGAGTGPSSKAKAFTFDGDAMRRVSHGLNMWNAVEVVLKGGDLKAYLNGTLITTVTQTEFTTPGHIGIQMQGYPMRWRNLRIREE